ncbi:mandelate racemase/muconate lactonizing enzyme family protein [Vulcanisaeta thermophila]|uniref:mandelate racemase/muconate lactonizing enzyme family protein n=1 Tax=Vulcanisaeta thermophila TaxID=867917 RepID=UPI000A00F81A|nr:mandelate racemase/muconate lactonizing enzyme family protein [Vulcanisaeta thermophila]
MPVIKDVEVYPVSDLATAKASPWASVSIIVRVVTSDGQVGYGEAVPTLRVNPVLRAIEEVRRLVIGKDPFRINYIYREWYKHDFYLTRSFESATAYSAVDISLHDLLGKYYGMPIYQLMGGLINEKIKAYANGWYSDCVTPDDFARRAKEVVNMGFKAMKFDPFGPYFDSMDTRGLEEAVERVRAVREAVGKYVDILIETHGRFNVNTAIQMVKAMEEFNPLFIEEPVHPDLNLEGLYKLKQVAPHVRIAVGERVISIEEALQLVSRGLVDVLQPDITNALGFTGMTRIRAITEAYGIELAPHNAFGPVQHAATLQFDASTYNLLIQESFYEFWPTWKRDLVNNAFKIEDGYYRVPSKPGLGIDINERLLTEMKFEGMEPFHEEEPVWVIKGTWRGYK